MKKAMVLAVAVVVSFVFLIGGCAKKEVLKGEGELKGQPTAVKEDPGAKEKAAAAKKAKKAPEVSTGDTARDRAVKEKPAKVAAKEAKQGKAAKEDEISLANIHFDFDKATLRPDVREMLKKHAELLSSNRNLHVTVEGHCDERGTAEYNLALGERRAAAAMKYLVQLGVEEKRIKTISYGFEKPLDPGHSEEAWAKNRRDSFVTLKLR